MDKDAYIELIKTQKEHWWFNGKRLIVNNFIHKYNQKKCPKILDLGCGTGALLNELSKLGIVSGMEYDSSAVVYCNKNFNYLVRQGSLPYNVPYDNATFDIVVACDVLEHIDQDRESIKKIYDLLNEDGLVIITVPALQCLWGYNDDFVQHKRRYNKKDLINKIILYGFKIERCTYFNSILFLPIYLIRKFKNLLEIKRPDLSETSTKGAINWLLKKIFFLEIFFVKYINMPIGVSLIIVARKEKHK